MHPELAVALLVAVLGRRLVVIAKDGPRPDDVEGVGQGGLLVGQVQVGRDAHARREAVDGAAAHALVQDGGQRAAVDDAREAGQAAAKVDDAHHLARRGVVEDALVGEAAAPRHGAGRDARRPAALLPVRVRVPRFVGGVGGEGLHHGQLLGLLVDRLENVSVLLGARLRQRRRRDGQPEQRAYARAGEEEYGGIDIAAAPAFGLRFRGGLVPFRLCIRNRRRLGRRGLRNRGLLLAQAR